MSDYEVTLRASTVARILTRALAGATARELASGSRTVAHVEAVLEQCGPGRESWATCRDMYARMGQVDVTFDLTVRAPRPRRARTVGTLPCEVEGCEARLSTRDSYTAHMRRQHDIYSTRGRPRKDAAA